MYDRQIPLTERIIAVATYLTMGFVGFVWLIIVLIRRSQLTRFLQYHIFQSIFISLAYVLLCYILGLTMNILSFVPFINVLVAQIALFLNAPLIFSFSIIQCIFHISGRKDF